MVDDGDQTQCHKCTKKNIFVREKRNSSVTLWLTNVTNITNYNDTQVLAIHYFQTYIIKNLFHIFEGTIFQNIVAKEQLKI